MIVSKFNLQFGILIVETNITYICNMWQIHATFQSFPYKVGTNMTQTQILNFGKTHFGLIHHKGSIKDLNSKRGQVEVEVIMTICICVSLRFLFEPKYWGIYCTKYLERKRVRLWKCSLFTCDTLPYPAFPQSFSVEPGLSLLQGQTILLI